MKIDPSRLARALTFLAWAGFFDWLWLSGAASSYVGPRTTWVVPFGAVVLTVSAVAYLAGVRTAVPGPRLSPAELLGLLALLAPILAVVVVPDPSLGALAVERKQSARAPVPPPSPEDRVYDVAESDPGNALLSVALADADPKYADTYGVYDGARIELFGLVSRQAAAPGAPFELSRFQASCCAADAIPYTARIRPAPGFTPRSHPTDAWVQVSGVVRAVPGGGFVVEAERAERRSEPSDPYLTAY